MSNSAVCNMKSIKESIKYQHIAPAPELSSSDGKIMPVHKFMSRMHNDSCNGDQIQSVARRNARERNRVKQVNNSFSKLRQHIPQYVINDLTKGGGRGPQKKISKVDTLRIAVEYIRRLQDLVEDLSDSSSLSGISENSSCSTFPMVDTTASIGDNSQTVVTSESYSPSKQCYGEQYQTSPLPAFEQTQMEIQRQQQKQYQSILTPSALNQTQLYVGCHSPTSSFNSSMSFDSGHFEAPQQMSPIMNSPIQLKHETYNSFNLHEEDCSPDDEEILDYISLWQDQQS